MHARLARTTAAVARFGGARLPGGLASFLRAPLDGMRPAGMDARNRIEAAGGRHSRPLSKGGGGISPARRLPVMASREGWVTSLADREVVQGALCGALIGRVLVGARYVELVYGEPAWDCGSFHSIDFGVELDTDDGRTTSFIWQQKGANETLLTYAGTIRDELVPEAEISTWDVGEIWRGAMPGAVRNVETIWTKHRWGPAFGGPKFETRVDDGRESDYCLITVVVSNDADDHVVITLGGEADDPEPQTFTYLADNVAVFFSVAEARRARALLRGDADALEL